MRSEFKKVPAGKISVCVAVRMVWGGAKLGAKRGTRLSRLLLAHIDAPHGSTVSHAEPDALLPGAAQPVPRVAPTCPILYHPALDRKDGGSVAAAPSRPHTDSG